jgi:hypothetical protein
MHCHGEFGVHHNLEFNWRPTELVQTASVATATVAAGVGKINAFICIC